MLRKLLVFAVTSGLVAKLYKNYIRKQPTADSRQPTGARAMTGRNMSCNSPTTTASTRSEG